MLNPLFGSKGKELSNSLVQIGEKKHHVVCAIVYTVHVPQKQADSMVGSAC